MLHFHKQGLRSSNLILLFLLLFTCPLFPQLLLRGVAPLSPDNYYKYVISMDGLHLDDSISYKVLDSIVTMDNQQYYTVKVKNPISAGYIYCGFSQDSFYVRYDTLGQDSIYKYLKFGANVGDTWSQQWYTSTLFFSVNDIYPVFIWGNVYEAKEIQLTDYGLISMVFLWTDSLGLISEFSEGQYIASLTGCVIDGRLYGDTSMYVTSVNDLEQPPQEFILLQNYPNPFNPSTSISYHLPQGGFVSLKVFDILGRKVAVLLNQWEPSGHHSVEFNAKDLSSGIYFYRISVNDFISTKKMLLIK